MMPRFWFMVFKALSAQPFNFIALHVAQLQEHAAATIANLHMSANT